MNVTINLDETIKITRWNENMEDTVWIKVSDLISNPNGYNASEIGHYLVNLIRKEQGLDPIPY